MNTKISIFYSWQSDSPKETNKDLIYKALGLVANRLGQDNELQITVAIDRDTQGVPGSPTIADTIFEKIENSDLFLADVTVVTPRGNPRSISNPNVLIELGYAAAKLGWHRIICVMNEKYGGMSKLPFDLRQRRWPLSYTLSASDDAQNIDREVLKLSGNIESAIRVAINSGVLIKKINLKDRIVASRFKSALDRMIGTIAVFLRDHQFEGGTAVFKEDYPDTPPKNLPDLELVQPIMKVLTENSFLSFSNASIGQRRINWIELIEGDFDTLRQECNRILDQYATQHDALIEMVEIIHNYAGTLAFMLNTSRSNSELLKMYQNGVPEVHRDWFQYFFLHSLKTYRIIREFV